MKEKRLVKLRNKISDWLRHPNKRLEGIELSRTLMNRGLTESRLPRLCKWIKDNGYTKQDVKEIRIRWQDSYIGDTGGGLKRIAGGCNRFKKKYQKLLDTCFK